MSVQLLNPPGMPKPLAPYSTATKAGDTIYVSGILALGIDGKTVGAGDVRMQTKHVIETIATILKSAGATLSDVAFNTIIVKDMGDYAAVNEVYREYFGAHPPCAILHRSAAGTGRVSGRDRLDRAHREFLTT